jgi:hypothetical protein
MARFYTDEDVPYGVVEAPRRLGHDVLTCEEAGRANRSIDDTVVLADAARMGRIMVTRNRDDFEHLHNGGQFHRGLVLCFFDPDTDRQARIIVSQVEGQSHGAPWLVKVRRGTPPGAPRGGIPH